MVLYLDIIFSINLLFDFLVLILTNYLTRSKKQYKRLFCAAIFAACIVPLEFLVPISFLNTVYFKSIYAVMIIFVAFGYNGFYRFTKNMSTFMFVMFSVGGGLFGLQFMIRETKFFHHKLLMTVQNLEGESISLLVLFACFPLFILFMKGKLDRHVKDKIKYDQIYMVTLEIDNVIKYTNGYIDSGNKLTDPLSGRPVAVCDASFLKQFFQADEWDEIIQCIEISHLNELPERLQHRISIVPYQGVGGSGLLYTIKPDKLTVYYEDEVLETDKVLIGIQTSQLTQDGSFHCLLHPELIKLKMEQAA